MSVFGEDIPDVTFHSETEIAVCIVPLLIDACILLSLPIDCDGVVLLEHQSEVIGIAFSILFDHEVINYKTEQDGTPFVAPKASSGSGFIVALFF